MSKKQPDGILERLASVAKTTDEHPELVRLMFSPNVQKLGQALELWVRDFLTPKPQSNTVATMTETQQLPPSVDEQPEAFTLAPLWPTTEDDPMAFMTGLRLVHPSQQSGIYRMPSISRPWL